MKAKNQWKRAFSVTLATALLCTSVNLPLTVQGAATVPGSIPEAVTLEIPSAAGTIYHVDSVMGNDETGDGSLEKPYKTLAMVNEIELQPGDGISLKCGSIFDDQTLAPKGKGTEEKPIVINSYGEGAMPVINAGGYKRTGKKNADGTPEYSGHKEAVLIENMEYTYVTGLEVTNDDAFNETSDASDPNNAKDGSDDEFPRRLGIHVTIDERAQDTYKGAEERDYKGIVIDGCYVHDVDGNENRGVNKVDGGIGVEVIFSTKAGIFPYFDGVTIQNNRIDQCDRSGIKAIRLSDLDQFRNNTPGTSNYDPNNDADNNSANDGVRHDNIRYRDQAQRGLHIVGNYLSDIGGDGILVCESQGALVEHNVVNGQAMRARGANAGIWAWNSFDTLFRYNESFDGPAWNQDGCSYDSDYWCAGTIFEYNYSHDTPMGFMLLMGGNDTDIIRYNVSQNDGGAWRHGAGNSNTPSYIYNNVFYYDAANWVFNNSNNAGDAMGGAYNWGMYNNIYYNYNKDAVSNWGVNTTVDSWAKSPLRIGGNLVYEAGGKHAEAELPGAIQADPLFENPGGGETATVSDDGMHAKTNWESLKAYALKEGSPAIGQGVYVNVVPQTSQKNKGLWDHESDRNAKADFFGNSLYDGAPDIGIMEMTGVAGGNFAIEKNAGYYIYDPECTKMLASTENGLETNASGSQFIMENVGDDFKIKVWDTQSNAYLYLHADNGKVSMSEKDSSVWTVTDQKNGLHLLKSGSEYLVCKNDGTLQMGEKGTQWQFQLNQHSKSYNAGGQEVDGFSADQAYDEANQLSGYTGEPQVLTNSAAQGVYATGLTGETVEYKIYAAEASHNLKLYVSEMENVKGRSFDVLVNGELKKERYTLAGDRDVIEIGSVYPVNGVITVKLQSAYSETAGIMSNPILNAVSADMAVMSEVNMRLDAGNTDTANMGNHDGLFEDAAFEDTGSGYYTNGADTEVVNSELNGNKPVPDAGMGTALKSGRAGEDFGYRIKAAPGLYRIKLYFNDTSADSFTPGTFDVSVNGNVVEENFKIEKQDTAYNITTTAQSKDGLLDIRFQSKDGKAIVNAVVAEPYEEIQGDNLALNKNASASKQETESMAPSFAVDNDQSTRYSSGEGEGHWIKVDLAKKYMVDKVAVDWTPGAYATSYIVEVSSDDTTWNTVKTVSGAYPGLNLVSFDPAEAQYVRITSLSNANQWGMSMTELGVYGEEITGKAAAAAATEDKGNNTYQVRVDLENIYSRYRNAMVEYTYDPAEMTLNTESAGYNEDALLKVVEPSVNENEDGTSTVRFTYGIKKQDAFKKLTEMMNVTFTTQEGALRKPVEVNVSFSNAEGHITTLDKAVTYVPNNFTYEDLQTLIESAQAQLDAAVVGFKPGEYTQESVDALKAVVDAAREVQEGMEVSDYEAAYLKLEAAVKAFTEAAIKAQFETYHKDFSLEEEANFEYSNASGKPGQDGMVISLGTKANAYDRSAPSINEGYFRIRFTTDNAGDQTKFVVGNRINIGFDAGSGCWFFDSADNLGGWGNFPYTMPLTENTEHVVELSFTLNENNLYDLHLWYDGADLGSISGANYGTASGQYGLVTRDTAHNMTIKEVYYGDMVDKHTITVTAGENGTVSQTGAIAVESETNKTFVFKPNKGYTVDTVLVDGKPAAVDGDRYTFEYVVSDHTLEVTFKKLDVTELTDLINEMKEIQADGYTAQSYEKFQEAIKAAENIAANATTQKEITDAVLDLQNAKAELVVIALESLRLNTDEVKTEYLLKEELDLTGLVVEAVYNDETSVVLSSDQYTVQGFDSDTIGPKQIIVTYTENGTEKTASFEVLVKMTVDTKSLEMAILMAERLEANSQAFTPGSWAAVEIALTEARELLNNPGASQEKVDAAFTKLIDACTKLETGVQSTGLQAAIEGAEAILEDPETAERYTEESIQAVKDALEAAKAVVKDIADGVYDEDTAAGQEAVNTATSNLLTAVSHMLDKDFARLHALIAQAQKILENGDKYTSASLEALQKALDEAKAAAGNTGITNAEVRKAYANLAEAVVGLEIKGNKAELENAINKAQDILDHSGKYLAATLTGLQEALDHAKAVYGDKDAVQSQIDEAVKALIGECLEVRLLGDVDFNGVVNAADSALLLKHNAELTELTDMQLLAADVNGDGTANTADASVILQYSAEMIDSF